MATTALILHRVDDYETWRTGYDAAEDIRRKGGVIGAEVLKPATGDNTVAVTHEFESPEAARAFFANDELKDAMERAGVDASSLEMHLLERD